MSAFLYFVVLAIGLTQAQTFNYTDLMGEIYSPNFPDDYDNNLDVYWNITVPEGYYINLLFQVFNSEECCDKLFIYDANDIDSNKLIRTLSGNCDGTIIVSNGSSLFLNFKTDLMNTSKGFYAKYTAYEVGVKPTEVPGCVGNYYAEEPFEAISSPNWPSLYKDNLICHYFLNVDVGEKVQLWINEFVTEGCCDHLTIYDGASENAPVLAKLSGETLSENLINSTSNIMYLTFTTDLEIDFQGFSGVFWGIDEKTGVRRTSKWDRQK